MFIKNKRKYTTITNVENAKRAEEELSMPFYVDQGEVEIPITDNLPNVRNIEESDVDPNAKSDSVIINNVGDEKGKTNTNSNIIL